jgi:hypothetical protein
MWMGQLACASWPVNISRVPAQIVPTGEENMAGFVVYSERVLDGFRKGLIPRNATRSL